MDPNFDAHWFVVCQTNVTHFVEALSTLIMDHTMRVCKAALSATKMVFLNEDLSHALIRHLPDLFVPIMNKMTEKIPSTLAEECWNASRKHIPPFDIMKMSLSLIQSRLESPRIDLSETALILSLEKAKYSISPTFTVEMGMSVIETSGDMLIALSKFNRMAMRTKSDLFDVEYLQRHVLKLIAQVKDTILWKYKYSFVIHKLPKEQQNAILQAARNCGNEWLDDLINSDDSNLSEKLMKNRIEDNPAEENTKKQNKKELKCVTFNFSEDKRLHEIDEREEVEEREGNEEGESNEERLDMDINRNSPEDLVKTEEELNKSREMSGSEIGKKEIPKGKKELRIVPESEPIEKFTKEPQTQSNDKETPGVGKLQLYEIVKLFERASKTSSSSHHMNLRIKALIQCAKDNRESDCWEKHFPNALKYVLGK